MKYDNTSDTWNSTLLTFSDLDGDICPILDDASIDCLGDVITPSPGVDSFLQYNGTAWVPGSVNFTEFIEDVCADNINGLDLDCLDDVDVGGAVNGDVLRFDGNNWVDAEITYDDIGGTPEDSALKGIGGGVHFSSLFNQTQVLNPAVLGTVDFTAGEAYRDITGAPDDLNGKVIIPYIGKNPGPSLFEVFYYHAGGANVVVTFYEYTTAQMNTGSVAGTSIGSFTTEAAPGYAVTLMIVNATASPSVWVPQTTTNDVFISAIL